MPKLVYNVPGRDGGNVLGFRVADKAGRIAWTLIHKLAKSISSRVVVLKW